ncbi:MAG: hypothetical protein J6C33_03815 [Lachnospiraceae bacterium]|nr:hypothetical protein [Lachnospiraceae bacterium]
MSKENRTAVEKDMRKETEKVGIRKKLSALFCTVMLTSMCWANVAFASSYAQNAYNNFLKDNLLWLAIAAIVIVILGAAAKKNYVGIVGTIIAGAIILFLISSPDKLKDMGNTIGNLIFQ